MIPRLDILGVQVSAIAMPDALATLDSQIAAGTGGVVCCAPAHLIIDAGEQPAVRDALNAADLVTPDGMAVVWLLKLRGTKGVERVYGPDLLQAACRYGLERGWSHYFYGGAPEVTAGLVRRLQSANPGLRVAGVDCPPFRTLSDDEQNTALERIRASGAHIVWVGLGSPRQELWMHAHRAALPGKTLVGVGAAFDFLSGSKAQAPRWVQRSGLEWLFRLVNEPGRLWRRYIRYPRFIWQALRQTLRQRFTRGE